jgi:response regulator RpfG family c-di-GMP phosphodiesterase
VAEKILFVDDEVLALAGYERILHREFSVSTATGGPQGLATIEANGPFAVVISDMRMPGMDGAEFLAEVRQNAPDTVRMLLTGHADLNAAIHAVNEGKIFRYLTKPCEKKVLSEAIASCLEHYRLRSDERKLLKKARRAADSDGEQEHGTDSASPAGLPGQAEARSHLVSVCGTDRKSVVALFRLPLFGIVERRYGRETANEYLKKEAEYLTKALSCDDWIYHWSCDVLLAIMRRQASASDVREEISRLLLESREHVFMIDEQNKTVCGKMTCDVLPSAEFVGADELLEAFADREIEGV